MPISHSHKFLFIEVPKTASTSVWKTLINKVDLLETEGMTYDKYDEYQDLDYFRFTFIRNPWDRAVSSWKHIMKKEKTNIEFRDFLYDIHNNPQKLTVKAQWHTGEQNLALRFNPRYIGRFETLEEDFSNICKIIGVENLKLKKLNVINEDNIPYQELYDNNTKDLVNKIYKKDIELFNYEF